MLRTEIDSMPQELDRGRLTRPPSASRFSSTWNTSRSGRPWSRSGPRMSDQAVSFCQNATESIYAVVDVDPKFPTNRTCMR